MTESEFLARAEATLNAIETTLERAAEAHDLGLESSRNGNVLEIELIDYGSKIIINSQAPMQEIWMASKSGGFHYRADGVRWVDTRNGPDLWLALAQTIQTLSGIRLALAEPG
jgi:CyaY protein